jgi:hypothetical protein
MIPSSPAPSSPQPVYSPGNRILRVLLTVLVATFVVGADLFSRLATRRVLAVKPSRTISGHAAERDSLIQGASS